MKIGAVGAELFYADGRTDGDKHDAVNSRLSQQVSTVRCSHRLLSLFRKLEALSSASPVYTESRTCNR
jgi:hypothetical protein